MNLPPAKRHKRPPIAASSPIILPDELFTELLSFLPVKSLMRFKCVCKSWKILFSDSSFVKLHFQRSKPNPQLVLVYRWQYLKYLNNAIVSPTSLSHLLESPSKPITLTNNRYYCLKDMDCRWVAGSCNGLLCLVGYSNRSREMWLRFWNPATRTISDKIGHYPDADISSQKAFGYDNSTDTYKVVYLHQGAKIFSLGDNVWRNIQSFPMNYRLNDGVHLRGSVNWLAIRNYIFENDVDYDYYDSVYVTTTKQFMIISLDLGTETYKELLLPRGFDQVPLIAPSLCVLMDCLCFSHVVEETHFVLWKMADYGVEESWTQLLMINFQIMNKFPSSVGFPWVPLHLSKNYDTLLLENVMADLTVVYNLRDGSVERIKITNGKCSSISIKNYVESLVLCH